MARSFNGSTDVIVATNATSFGANAVQSMVCWVYFNSVASNAYFFNIWDSSFNWLLGIFGGSPLQFFGSGGSVTGLANVSTGTWYHVCGTYNGTTLQLFQDGVSQGTSAGSVGGGANIRMGHGQGQYLNGRLADCAHYNVVLTQGEISALAKGARPYQIRRSALVEYWPLDGLASPEPDLSGSANNGVLTGSPSASSGPPATLWSPKRPHWALALPEPPPTAYVQMHQPIQYVNRVVGY